MHLKQQQWYQQGIIVGFYAMSQQIIHVNLELNY